MLRLYAIAFTVLATFAAAAVFAVSYIGIRSSAIVALAGLATTVLAVVLMSVEIGASRAEEPAREREPAEPAPPVPLQHAHEQQ